MRAIPLQGIWCSDNLLNEEKRDDESPYLQRRLQQRLSELLVDKRELVSLFFFQFKEVSYENAFAPKSFIMISSIRFPSSDGYEN